jgi:GTP-binding protein EngB required for normal cell division
VNDSAALETLGRLADESGAAEIAAEARALTARAAEGRFYVACVGQFKRGKSTLINAIVGAPVLPTGVAPVTSIPTTVRYGEPAARVRLLQGGWVAVERGALAEWVTEEGNPDNQKQVAGVEIFEPSPLLANGMCLVDTPGLGSVFDRSTQATRELIPQIDAAVVVLGIDPPISGGELELVGAVARQVDHLIFVLNKADRFRPDELHEAKAFTERTLSRRLPRAPGPLFQVSALAAFRRESAAGEWAALVETLEHLAATSGRTLVAGALSRGRERLERRLNSVLVEQRAALLRPLEQSERRVRELDSAVAEADRALAELGPLLGLDQRRVSLSFARREEEFLARSVPAGLGELRHRLAGAAPAGARLRRRHALELANEVARGLLQPWLAESERAADTEYRDAVARFVGRARDLLSRLALPAYRDMVEPALDGEQGEMLSGRRGFYFTDLLHRHVPAAPWVWIADALAPRALERRRAVAAAEAYVADLLRVNAARVRGDLDDRLGESRHRLEARLRIVLHEGWEAASGALERARAAHAAGQSAVERELGAIHDRMTRLGAVCRAEPGTGRPTEGARVNVG